MSVSRPKSRDAAKFFAFLFLTQPFGVYNGAKTCHFRSLRCLWLASLN